jgi:hypothetical protein
LVLFTRLVASTLTAQIALKNSTPLTPLLSSQEQFW